MAKDCKGVKFEVGQQIAVAGQGRIWTGVLVGIVARTERWRRNTEADIERYKQRGGYSRWIEHLQGKLADGSLLYKIRKDENNKLATIEEPKRLIVLTSPQKAVK